MQETLHKTNRDNQKSQDPGYQGLASDSHEILQFSLTQLDVNLTILYILGILKHEPPLHMPTRH